MKKTLFPRPLKILLLTALLSQGGCIHKPDVEQGNIVTPAQLSQLHTGMSEDEVKALLGSPLLNVPFNQNRLEYAYTLQKGQQAGKGYCLSLLFKDDKLIKIQHEKSFSLPE